MIDSVFHIPPQLPTTLRTTQPIAYRKQGEENSCLPLCNLQRAVQMYPPIAFYELHPYVIRWTNDGKRLGFKYYFQAVFARDSWDH